jgi:hypothetical protein
MNGGFPSLEHQVDVKRKVIQKMKEKKRHHKEYEKVLTLECFLVKKEEKKWRERHQFSPISCTWHHTYSRVPNKRK